MALKVIGAGWGRTGTESLKIALEQLGFDRCYHGFALFNDGRRLKYWKELHETGTTDFDALYKTNFNYSTQLFLFYGIFIAFAVKTPTIFLNT